MANIPFLISFPAGAEWFVILGGVLLLFGGKKIPELMRGVGKGIREFNDAKGKVRDQIEDGMKRAEQEEQVKAQAAPQAANTADSANA